jgi:hypothetical protein
VWNWYFAAFYTAGSNRRGHAGWNLGARNRPSTGAIHALQQLAGGFDLRADAGQQQPVGRLKFLVGTRIDPAAIAAPKCIPHL